MPHWRDTLSQAIHQRGDQHGCYAMGPICGSSAGSDCLPWESEASSLQTLISAYGPALHLKGFPCSLNNSTYPVCVTLTYPSAEKHVEPLCCNTNCSTSATAMLGTSIIPTFPKQNLTKILNGRGKKQKFHSQQYLLILVERLMTKCFYSLATQHRCQPRRRRRKLLHPAPAGPEGPNHPITGMHKALLVSSGVAAALLPQ